MKRRLSNILISLFFVLSLATAVFWIRSLWITDFFSFTVGQSACQIQSESSTIAWSIDDTPSAPPKTFHESQSAGPSTFNWHKWGFGRVSTTNIIGDNPPTHFALYRVPDWYTIFLFAALVGLALYRRSHPRRPRSTRT